MLARGLGVGAGQHAGDLGDPRPRRRPAPTDVNVSRPSTLLGHAELRVGRRRDLGQVGHDQHLLSPPSSASAAPTATAAAPPMPASTSSNTSVAAPDTAAGADQREPQGEHRPRQLAAGRHPARAAAAAIRGWRRAGTGRDRRGDRRRASPTSIAIDACGIASVRSRCSIAAARSGATSRGGDARRSRPGVARSASALARVPGRARRRAARSCSSSLEPALGLGVERHDLGQVVAVLAAQVLEQLPAFADLAQPFRVFLDRVGRECAGRRRCRRARP